MPHHGSSLNKNLVDGFVERVGAETILISCSRNRYEGTYRPGEGVEGFYTAVDGAITLRVSKKGLIEVESFRGRKKRAFEY